MDEHTIERTDEGCMIVLKTEGFRLAISDDSFGYLTDLNTGPGTGCTCHISTTWDIQNLRALLDEGEKVLQERELADAAKDFDEGFDDIPHIVVTGDDEGDFDPEIDRLSDDSYCRGCGNLITCCECD